MSPSHYETRLTRDLREIQQDVSTMGRRVALAVEQAVRALFTRDRTLAYRTILEDNPINRDIRALDRKCYFFIARHLPSAGHLRLISTILRLNIALERIGDYAVTISREAAWLGDLPEGTLRRDMEQMSQDALQMFKQAMNAFNEQNADLAAGTATQAKPIDRTFANAFEDLIEAGRSDTITTKQLLASVSILTAIDRVSDQAKNICEDTIFAVRGEMKKTKAFRILFVDRSRDHLSALAELIAERTFPEDGVYYSAALDAASRFAPEYLAFLEERGLEPIAQRPAPMSFTPSALDDFQIIVAINEDVTAFVEAVPFHTIALRWNLPARTKADSPQAYYEAVYRVLALQISDLMHLLHGAEAR